MNSDLTAYFSMLPILSLLSSILATTFQVVCCSVLNIWLHSLTLLLPEFQFGDRATVVTEVWATRRLKFFISMVFWGWDSGFRIIHLHAVTNFSRKSQYRSRNLCHSKDSFNLIIVSPFRGRSYTAPQPPHLASLFVFVSYAISDLIIRSPPNSSMQLRFS